ncbi:hypothetical protein QQP08_017463 [Theobroma cacao]|nr:hypothetical protein QQP08_017463 [Theobroma cacao]
MNVILVEPCLEISKVHLSKWLIKGSFAYVVRNNVDSLKSEMYKFGCFVFNMNHRLVLPWSRLS